MAEKLTYKPTTANSVKKFPTYSDDTFVINRAYQQFNIYHICPIKRTVRVEVGKFF